MTAEVIPMPAPRNPLLDEMLTAYGEALLVRNSDPLRSQFFAGLGLGYSIAFGFNVREPLDRARRQPGSSCVHVDFRQPRWDDDEETLWACGVRYGYSLGTSERPDAEDCAMCGDRIVSGDDDFERCDDGFFCGFGADCSRIWHSNGPHTCGGDE